MYPMKSKLVFLLLLLFLLKITVSAQKTEVVEVDLDTVATLYWGQVSIPVSSSITNRRTDGKIINFKPLPQNYIPISHLISSLKERIFLYDHEELSNTTITSLHLSLFLSHKYTQKAINKGASTAEAQDKSRANNLLLKLTTSDLKGLSTSDIEKILSRVKHHTFIHFNIKVNNNIFYGQGLVVDQNAPYEAPSMVHQRPFEPYNFQLLDPLDAATILRIDTLTNKKIFGYYKNDGQTKIIHIPNFKTSRTTVDEKNEDNLEKIVSLPSSYPTGEALNMPEFVDFSPSTLKLHLGEFIANPESKNISLEDFRVKKRKFSLWQNNKELKIKRFRLIIFDKQNEPKSFIINNLNNQEWQNYFKLLAPENAIYFDKIIMEKNGESFYLGQSFLFKIEKAHLVK